MTSELGAARSSLTAEGWFMGGRPDDIKNAEKSDALSFCAQRDRGWAPEDWKRAFLIPARL